MASRGQPWPAGPTVDYAPDALGQATRVGNFATDVRYYANGGIKQFTYGNGIVHTMQQNERQLPVRSTDSGVLDFDARFDRNGNVSDIYNLALGAFYNRHMLYDGLDRLIAAGSNNFGGDSWHRFSYDALDNLTSWMLPGVKDHRYWYDAHNRLTNLRDGAGNTLIGLSYDVQGNLKLKNGLNHVFDYGNRLREVSGKESYRYDALGRRIFASAPGLGVVLSQYAQDGRLVFQSDGRKGLGREYVHLAGSLIARRDYAGVDAKITYLHTDALGSPVASTDASGIVIERTHYEPYGAPIGKVVDGPGYTGHVMDGETGLVQMQQRYYDPQLGVFLSVDPVTAYQTKDWRLFHRYGYAFNNPYSFTDPDGRLATDDKAPPPPPPEPKTLETVTITAPRPNVVSGSGPNSSPQPRVPSFFRLTTTEALRRDRSSEQAIEDGELTRTVTLPAMIVTASPSAIALGGSTLPVTGEATLVIGSTLYKSKTARELFFGCLVGIGVCQGGRPSMQRINQQERLQQAREGSMRETRQHATQVP